MLALILLPSSLLSPRSWLPAFSRTPKSPAAAAQLCTALVSGETSSAVLKPLVDDCCAANVPFRAELLGDGALWRAVSIVEGETPRWERNAKLLPFFNNRAGQSYSLGGKNGGGEVTNYGEVCAYQGDQTHYHSTLRAPALPLARARQQTGACICTSAAQSAYICLHAAHD